MPQDAIGICAHAIIRTQDNMFLMCRRGPAARDRIGLFEFPGGEVHFGETAIKAVIREVHEELGLDIAHLDHGDGAFVVVELMDPEEQQHWISFAFLFNYPGHAGSLQLADRDVAKIDSVVWINAGEVALLECTPLAEDLLERYRQTFM